MAQDASEDKLDSWKAIAAFLDREVRTVQRWEAEGLPVYRRTLLKKASVWAFKSELEEWLEQRKDLKAANEILLTESPSEAPPAVVASRHMFVVRRFRWLALAMIVLSVVAIILWFDRTPPPGPRPVLVGKLLARGTEEGGRFERIVVGKTPFRLALTPDGNELYVTNNGSGTVSVIQPRTRQVTHTLAVNSQPGAIVFSPDGRRVYVASEVSGLSVIDTRSKAVTPVSTGGPVQSLAMTGDGTRLYMAMGYRGLKRLAVSSNTVESIPVVGCPYGLAIDPPGKRLYISYRCGGPGGRVGWDAIEVMDTDREVSVGTVNGLPLVAGQIGISSDNSQVWVSGSDRCFSTNYDHSDCPKIPGGLFQVIRAFDLKHLAAIGIDAPTQGGASSYPDGSRMILLGSELVEVRDTANFTVLENLEKTTFVGSVVFSADGRSAFAAQNLPDGVVVLEPELPECEPLRNGLYHLWPADGNMNDTEGQNHGKPKGGYRFVPGRRGQSLRLDGTGVVELPPHRGFLNSSEHLIRLDWTLAAWMKPFSIDSDTVVIGTARRDYSWIFGQARTGHWKFQVGSITLESKTRGESGQWHHVALVHSRGLVSLYVNGVKESQIKIPRIDASPAIAATIGADPRGGRSFRGLIDEVRIHQAALPEPTLRSIARGDRAVCEGAGLPSTH